MNYLNVNFSPCLSDQTTIPALYVTAVVVANNPRGFWKRLGLPSIMTLTQSYSLFALDSQRMENLNL